MINSVIFFILNRDAWNFEFSQLYSRPELKLNNQNIQVVKIVS